MVRQGSAKPLYAGSIPTMASIAFESSLNKRLQQTHCICINVAQLRNYSANTKAMCRKYRSDFPARVAELVYARDLKSRLNWDAGSTPAPGTVLS